jgi:thiol-disulfide isomerase/thioredoxin
MKYITRHRFLSGVIALVVIAAIGYYLRWHPRRGMPAFTAEYKLMMQTYDGKSISLSSFKHRVLVVHSWASWCSYCGDEMKALSQLQKQYGTKVTVLEVNRAESKPDAMPFSTNLGLDLGVRVLLDPKDAYYKAIGGYAMPETLFVDDRGEIVYHSRGPLSSSEMQSHIDAMLK